jgi:hypothetical protein
LGNPERRMSAANVRSICATALAALAVCTVPIGAAHARLFWPQWGYWWGDHAPLRHSHRHRHAEPKSEKKDQVQDAPKGPLQIIISISDQRVSVYDNGALVARSAVSTGIPGHPTPLGVPRGKRPSRTPQPGTEIGYASISVLALVSRHGQENQSP